VGEREQLGKDLVAELEHGADLVFVEAGAGVEDLPPGDGEDVAIVRGGGGDCGRRGGCGQ
jgi:hypothetical protein